MKIKHFFTVILFAVIAFTGLTNFAYAADPVELPAWIKAAVDFLMGMPTIGPILVEILKYLGIVAVILTAISAFLISIKKALEGIVKIAPFLGFLDKGIAFLDKIIYYAQYLSIFNVKKPQP